ncbi:hypothetical protein [Leptospira interrogans]|uniref:hypothetical protein n=1 Tax=Leptospira interrogans TaxID=173 RepID=UPI0002CAF115|nr:hypothetical protein [Leptospira interrogans]ENO72020.1 hypothetical protein LEP1GSC012_2240 [Leptospira interrogans serovar Valbuzzi str. Valbuzzi]
MKNRIYRCQIFGLILFISISIWTSYQISQSSQVKIPKSVVSLVINHSEIAKFLHPEVKDRLPLILSDHLLEPNIKLSKFERPVQILPDTKIGSRPHIRFLSFQTNGRHTKTTIEYQIEGLYATFFVELNKNEIWNIKKTIIIEK